MRKSLLSGAVVLFVFAFGIYVALNLGRELQPLPAAATHGFTLTNASPVAVEVGPAPSLWANLRENLHDPLGRLLMQLILVVSATRVCGRLARRVGQPAVIGEMLAGIILGPSLLGWIWPGAFHFLFPAPSLVTLRLLSRIGVCLFLFVVGMELDLGQLKQRAHAAVVVSQVSILCPFFLGVAVSLALFPGLAGARTTFLAFALFLGISMSITAFPVLARILDERALTRTSLGALAVACAAANDITAWCLLAFVVAIAKSSGLAAAVLSLGLLVLFVVTMVGWIKPRLPRWIAGVCDAVSTPSPGAMGAVLVFLLASALATDLMGIHALFGAFLAGVVMPAHGEFRDYLKVRLEHFSSVFLLPLFFAFIGLRTQIGLLTDPGSLLVCAELILVATLGKLGATTVTARLSGVGWIDAFALGAMMNTRGLVELIALNIGYDLGILSPQIFAMLVVMALVTTCLTGPLLALAEALRARRALAVSTAQPRHGRA
ncbi:MAG: cation:proton antiporter [Verrucomicrobia bacterium]|nr:cation:proton antiporter [Verrucomicrobiota bacterium]